MCFQFSFSIFFSFFCILWATDRCNSRRGDVDAANDQMKQNKRNTHGLCVLEIKVRAQKRRKSKSNEERCCGVEPVHHFANRVFSVDNVGTKFIIWTYNKHISNIGQDLHGHKASLHFEMWPAIRYII